MGKELDLLRSLIPNGRLICTDIFRNIIIINNIKKLIQITRRNIPQQLCITQLDEEHKRIKSTTIMKMLDNPREMNY